MQDLMLIALWLVTIILCGVAVIVISFAFLLIRIAWCKAHSQHNTLPIQVAAHEAFTAYQKDLCDGRAHLKPVAWTELSPSVQSAWFAAIRRLS